MKQKKHSEVMARREGLVVQEMEDETLVYDLERHSAHCLNETAAFIWNHCDGETKPAKIAALMTKKWRKPVDEDVVWLAMKQLRRANLLDAPPVAHAKRIDASRRAAIQKLGLAAALSVPLVTSIVSPTAAAAASVPVQCIDCISRGQGQFFPALCTGLCKDVSGTCYENSGCGSGQALPECMTCFDCATASQAVGSTIKSWERPGTLKCA